MYTVKNTIIFVHGEHFEQWLILQPIPIGINYYFYKLFFLPLASFTEVELSLFGYSLSNVHSGA